MDKKEFFEFNSKFKGLSNLLNIRNDLFDLDYMEILEKEMNKLPKKCNVKNEIIIFDMATGEQYNCCTETGLKRQYNKEITIKNDYCYTECSLNTEHIIEFKNE
jgi:hypothetical protein